ncbi:MAG: YicC/YloC family endoribonuclease [Sphingobacteriaceae bacterium]
MIKSMTGFGLASRNSEHSKFTVEIKSLNSKFLELSLKMPKAYSEKELFLRNECSKQIERGKVYIAITAENLNGETKTAQIDREKLNSYYQQLKSTAAELGDPSQNLLQIALNFPEVISYQEENGSEEEWTLIYETYQDALKNFQTFRTDEGEILKNDVLMRIKQIVANLFEVEKLEVNRVPAIREKLNNLLAENVGKENIDHNRFEQELIYYIDKLDITEEKIRLKSHCDYFLETLNHPDANGKKLGFISQEIGREINTIGSKANDATIQQLVVNMKEELEKIKEQLLNVL